MMKTKKMKKLMALLLALIMIMGVSVTTCAENDDGTITVRNATVGETYKAYKIFDLTYKGTPTKDTTKTPAPVTSPVSYTYTRTDAANGTYPATATDKLYNFLSAASSPFKLEATSTAGVYNVTFNNNYNYDKATDTYSPPTDAQIIEFIAKKTGNNTRPDIEGTLLSNQWIDPRSADIDSNKKATGNSVTFENMDYGYYYITSTLGSVVTVDSTLKDVTVIDKNEGPTWDGKGKAIKVADPVCGKKVGDLEADGKTKHSHVDACYQLDQNSASYGDKVNFEINVNATAFAAPVLTTGTKVPAAPANSTAESEIVTYYHIKDTLGTGFSAAKDLKVTILYTDDSGKDQSKELTNESTATTKTYTAGTYTVKVDPNNTNEFELLIPVVSTTEVKDAKGTVTGYNYQTPYGSNFKIHVSYSAVVEDDAVIAGAGNKNTANFTYETKAFDPDTPAKDKPPVPGTGTYETNNKKETTTYVFALGIEKVSPEGTHLKGAEFSLYLKEEVTAGKYTYTELKGIQISDGVYKFVRVDANGYLINNENKHVDADGNVLKDTDTPVKPTGTVVGQFKTDDREKLTVPDPDNAGKTKEINNPAFGTLTIKGLAEDTYSLREKVAPVTYNLLNNYIDVSPVVTNVSKYTESVTTYYDKNGNILSAKTDTNYDHETTATYPAKVTPLVVVNKQGIELPSTGGLGTRTIYMLGACLAISAYLLLYTRKRMAL